MKLQLPSVPSKEQIKALLEQRLPQYKYSFRGKIVVVELTSFTGAMVVPRKDGVIINGNFPSMGAMFVYIILLFGTGILVGLLIWALVWRGGQNKVRDEVAGAMQQALGVARAA